MKVLFISPHYPEEMQEFTRGLSEVGARVYGVGDVPLQQIPSHVRRYLSGYIQTASLFAEDRAVADIAPAVRHLGLDRVECLWEPCIELAAKLREQLDLPGMRYVDAVAFRDKAIMKERLVAAGLRVPHFARASTASMVWEAAERIGYPLIIKPIAGAGSKDTYRVEDPKGLQAVLDLVKHVRVGQSAGLRGQSPRAGHPSRALGAAVLLVAPPMHEPVLDIAGTRSRRRPAATS